MALTLRLPSRQPASAVRGVPPPRALRWPWSGGTCSPLSTWPPFPLAGPGVLLIPWLLFWLENLKGRGKGGLCRAVRFPWPRYLSCSWVSDGHLGMDLLGNTTLPTLCRRVAAAPLCPRDPLPGEGTHLPPRPAQPCRLLAAAGIKRNILFLSLSSICSQIMYKTFAETTYSSCIFYESDPKLKYINIKISRSTLGKKKSYFIKYQETNLKPRRSSRPPVQHCLMARRSAGFSHQRGPFPSFIRPLPLAGSGFHT